MGCERTDCPYCGGALIHQDKRGNGESSSAYGQHIHDDHENSFFWADVDGVIYKFATRIMRIIEHKPVDGSLSKSQRTILPLLAAALDVLVAEDVLDPDSGVFLVQSDPPYDTARVRRYRRDADGTWIPGTSTDAVELTGEDLRHFETGMPVSRPQLSGRAVEEPDAAPVSDPWADVVVRRPPDWKGAA